MKNAWLYLDLVQALKGLLERSRFSTEGTLNPPSAVSRCRTMISIMIIIMQPKIPLLVSARKTPVLRFLKQTAGMNNNRYTDLHKAKATKMLYTPEASKSDPRQALE